MAHTQKSAARAIKRDFTQCLARGNHRVAQNDEPEPGNLTEADLLAIDRAYEAAKDERCADFGQREADRATALEIARDPMGGFAS